MILIGEWQPLFLKYISSAAYKGEIYEGGNL